MLNKYRDIHNLTSVGRADKAAILRAANGGYQLEASHHTSPNRTRLSAFSPILEQLNTIACDESLRLSEVVVPAQIDAKKLRELVEGLAHSQKGQRLKPSLHDLSPPSLEHVARGTETLLRKSRSKTLLLGAIYIADLHAPYSPASAIRLLGVALSTAQRSQRSIYADMIYCLQLHNYYLLDLVHDKDALHAFDGKKTASLMAPRLLALHLKTESFLLAINRFPENRLDAPSISTQTTADFLTIMLPQFFGFLDEARLPLLKSYYSWRFGGITMLPEHFPRDLHRHSALCNTLREGQAQARSEIKAPTICYNDPTENVAAVLSGSIAFCRWLLAHDLAHEALTITKEGEAYANTRAFGDVGADRTLRTELLLLRIEASCCKVQGLDKHPDTDYVPEWEQRWQQSQRRDLLLELDRAMMFAQRIIARPQTESRLIALFENLRQKYSEILSRFF